MDTRDYAVITGGYWAFTITDGALRMLVLLQFHELGYSAVSIAFLFLLYEAMGVATNLVGGWIAARHGLRRTLLAGLGLQVVTLASLTAHDEAWATAASVLFVMGLQALSGVAKDLTKMSSKSSVKFVAQAGGGRLFQLVATLTGSKNALKGVGFFVGAALLSRVGYDAALLTLAALVGFAFVASFALLGPDTPRAARPRPLRNVRSESDEINRLSIARFFLFGARDIWFVVALPVFLDEVLGWAYEGIGAFLALWVIGYGVVQAIAPRVARISSDDLVASRVWAWLLVLVAVAIAAITTGDVAVDVAVPVGLIVFGVVFAMNSSLHSYLVLAYSNDDQVTQDVGFYYSANAAGRLVGTLLSGSLYLWGEFTLALWGTATFVLVAALMTEKLRTPETHRRAHAPRAPARG